MRDAARAALKEQRLTLAGSTRCSHGSLH